jgi:hypothetical protein
MGGLRVSPPKASGGKTALQPCIFKELYFSVSFGNKLRASTQYVLQFPLAINYVFFSSLLSKNVLLQ